MNTLRGIKLNKVTIKYFVVTLFLFAHFQLIRAQHFSNLYYDKRPAMLFGSMQVCNSNYYVTGVTTTKTGPPYYEKALFGKIYQAGNVDSIYEIIDSNQYSYALFMNALKKTSDGNFITTGYLNDSVEKAFLMKIDTSGNILLWHEYADSVTNLYQGQDIVELPGRGYLIAVNFEDSSYINNAMIIRTDAFGNIINQKLYAVSGEGIPWVIRAMLNGSFLVGGSNSKLNGNTPYWTQTWLIEVDSMGNMVRNWLDSDMNTGWPCGMLQTPDSGWVITRQYLDYDVNDYQQFKASVVKLDKDFNKKWELIMGDSSSTTILYDVETLPDGNFITCGTTPTWGYDSAYFWGWLVKIDTGGNVVWDRKFPAVARYGVESTLYDLQIMPNGDLLACGEMDYTVDLGITPIQQAWIVRTDSNGCVLDYCWPTEVQSIEADNLVSVKAFPNPATATCTLQIDAPDQMSSATVLDALGRQVMPIFTNQQLSTFDFNCNGLSSGLYFVKVIDVQGKVEVLKLVKQ